MFWDSFYAICKNSGTSPNAVCKEIGLSNAAATGWKNGTLPKADVLCKIADYLHVSVDSLLGRDTSNDTEIPNADRDTMMKYSALPDSVKASLAGLIDELSIRNS